MLATMMFIVIIVLTIVINRIYHKIFKTVFYIGWRPVFMEWFACFCIATLITASILSLFVKNDPDRDKGRNTASSESYIETDEDMEDNKEYLDYDEEDNLETIFAEEQEDFINANPNFFPAGYDDLDELEPYINYSLDYAYMSKNPLRYNGTFAFLENLQVNQIWDENADMEEIEAEDIEGNLYYVLYPNMNVNAVKGDLVRVIAMPVVSLSDGNEPEAQGTTLVMLAGLVETMSASELSGGYFSNMEAYPKDAAGNLQEESGSNNPYGDSLLLWKSFYEPLSPEDVAGLSADELRVARNEIYAAYGRQFSSADLKAYFEGKSWYSGRVPADQFSDDILTEVQKNNVALISSYEK